MTPGGLKDPLIHRRLLLMAYGTFVVGGIK